MAHPIRVLIADDNVHVREGLRSLLGIWPDTTVVGEAVNGQEAIRLVVEQRPDAVLMDIRMPVLDGLEATRHIKQLCPWVTVVVLTLYATERSAALAAGADAFMTKEGNLGRLLTALGVPIPGEEP